MSRSIFSLPVPQTPRIEPHQRLRPQFIPRPHKLRDIHIQRTVRLRTREQLLHRLECLCDCIRRTPRRLEKIKADLAGLEVDVWMADWCDEGYCRRREGVGWGDCDGELPEAVWEVLAAD